MKNLIIFFGVLTILSVTRFVPHPPNFTSLIALSFYTPLFFGQKKIFFVLASFILTDLLIGYHPITHWTWGSIFLISFIIKYTKKNIFHRMFGVFVASLLFFIITNFGVWTLGGYGYTFDGFLNCYIAAIPFYGNTIISSIIYSIVFEIANYLYSYFFYSKKNFIN